MAEAMRTENIQTENIQTENIQTENIQTENIQAENKHWNVIVAGGGIAGISAALAAKRSGAGRVLMIEKQFMPGGLATAGLITIYVPLCDGFGHQVSFGIAEELLRLSVSHGAEKGCDAWLLENNPEQRRKERFRVQFNAQIFALLCEELLRKEGVNILYGTSVCGASLEGSRIRSLSVENKGGRTELSADSFVDATGDADICRLSGCPTERAQKGNSLAAWYYAVENGRYTMRQIGFRDTPEDSWDKDDAPKAQTSDEKLYTGLTGEDCSRMSEDAHRAILKEFLRGGDLSPHHVLATIATIPQLRMTRKLSGAYTLDEREKDSKFPDSIGMISDWRRRGPVFEIPFRCLYNPQVSNLTVAGRCISVTDDMWDVSRVITPCAVTGQAAGTAAALSSHLPALDISLLQEKLEKDRVLLHRNW